MNQKDLKILVLKSTGKHSKQTIIFMLGRTSSVLLCNQIQSCSHTTTVHNDALVLFRVTGHSSATFFTDSYDKHR